MEEWEKALTKFLVPWKMRDEVIGFLVCGSYVTGNPSKRSDIDLHIITSDNVDWRERGSKFIDGYHIEYFVNPAKQIRAYFKQDAQDNRLDSSTQFLTGRILFDEDGSIAQLKREAGEWRRNQFVGFDETGLILQKYSLWDTFDNIQNLFENKSNSLKYAYYSALKEILEFYSKYIKWEIYSPEHVYEFFTDPSVREKYLLSEFPDKVFRDLFVRSITVFQNHEMLMSIKELVEYVFDKTGGFEIDGWVVRTPLSASYLE